MQTLNNTDTLTPAEKIRWIARAKEQLFALLRAEICGEQLPEEIKAALTPECVKGVYALAKTHDLVHLAGDTLAKNKLIPDDPALRMQLTKAVYTAVYRYEQSQRETARLSAVMEESQIPFVLLKGAVIRDYYPEPWMRTSCDIDVLVHREDLENAISYLVSNQNYIEKERATHDVSLFTQTRIHVELHFDLVEEGRAQNAIDVLHSVWDNVTLHENSNYWYEMSDSYFYFYHIAHMAKHFENGGCGIRPFIDLWILDHMKGIDLSARDVLLSQGGLLKFAYASQTLSEVWFGGKEPDELSLQMQEFLLHGGVYGSTDNRVALQQKKKGGRIGYVLSRLFIPYAKLKRYYPVLEKHRWLMPLMQIRRWFMLLNPDVAEMAKREMTVNGNLAKTKTNEMNAFLEDIGLN